MFGRNRDDRSSSYDSQNRDRSTRDQSWRSDRDDRDESYSSDDRAGQRFTSADRTYAMNDRSYGGEFSSREQYPNSRGESGYSRDYDRSSSSSSDRDSQRYESSRFGREGSRDMSSRGGYMRDFSPGENGYSEYNMYRGQQGEASHGPRPYDHGSRSSSQGSQLYGGTFGNSYSGQPGLSRGGSGRYSSPSSQGYRAYQDYDDESTANRSWSPDAYSSTGSQYAGSRSSGQSNYGGTNSQYTAGTSSETQRGRGYFGKGPKGYKRSDEKIHDEVCEILTSHYEIDASEVEVEVKDGVVTLGGAVESRRIKRLAEDIVADMNGVQDVRNNMRVLSHDSRLLESSSDGKSSSTYRSSSASTDSSLGSGRSAKGSSATSSSTSTTRQ